MTPEEFVDACGDGVYNLALRLAGNEADARDIAQEALLRSIRALPSFRGDAAPSTWAYRITVNVWKNMLRGAARHGGSPVPLDSVNEAGPASIAADDSPRAEAADSVSSALAALQPEERAILTLRELEGRSYAEIAEIMEIPEGTVKSRLYHAREELRARLCGGGSNA